MGKPTDEKAKERPTTASSSATGLSSESASASSSTGNQPPPEYEAAQERVLVDFPKLSLGEDLGSPIDGTITTDQCIAHLKFLAVLADLRDSISNQDGLFGIFDSQANKFPDSYDQAMIRIREKRWAVYTARAADRYEKWFMTALPQFRPPATLSDVESNTYENITDCKTKALWTDKIMPPLDILMVWHSHMLNPRNFLEDCIRYGKMSIWRTGFPFEAVNASIRDNTLEYLTSAGCQEAFEREMKVKWDNLEDPPTKTIKCPRCGQDNSVAWTEGEIGESVDNAFSDNNGLADNKFETTCKTCRGTVDHGRLRVAKFRNNLRRLLYNKEPMPGAVLNINGVPEGPGNNIRRIQIHTNMMFPSKALQACGQELMALTDPRLDRCRSVEDLRTQLEPRIREFKVLVAAFGRAGAPIRPGAKVHFRRMMSRYWDNSSPFALDLVGAVIRQGTFIQKMDNIDWLHSPALMETTKRLIKKYTVFLGIIFANPKEMAVPTLDVDLAWHTHQLKPQRYYKYTTKMTPERTRRFIDHDDKVEENKLSESFEWTSKMYRRATNGGIYSECTCWYCEATRAPDLYDRLINIGSSSRARNNADSLHNRQDISSDPDRNPHISAHNAVRPPIRDPQDTGLGYLQRMRLHRNYEKACRRAEKRGRPRSDSRSGANGVEPAYYAPYVWGYPMMGLLETAARELVVEVWQPAHVVELVVQAVLEEELLVAEVEAVVVVAEEAVEVEEEAVEEVVEGAEEAVEVVVVVVVKEPHKTESLL
ncbi:Protein of unknown function DUF1399 [Penicillium angulare]|uniref:Protein of unknown function DUF1399 n=1 Tax=Penicillium angulare TaxID=116970 RepID=UPI002541CAE6|nr:Protein of unknown function DUF1399 [Penicillium angulare]KAJ5287682.1 Protein of unknown function DUF1399 [Penicillium angulare]